MQPDFTVSGGCGDTVCDAAGLSISPANIFTEFDGVFYDFAYAWVGVAVDDFSAHLELEINLLAPSSTCSNELSYTFLDPSNLLFVSGSWYHGAYVACIFLGYLSIFFDGSFIFTPEIHGWVNTTTPVTFTAGIDLVISSGIYIQTPSVFNKIL